MRYPRVRRFACPDQRKYPLNSKKRVRNALSRYDQKKTVKCTGGKERICRAAKEYGIKARSCR
jgi:Family of unknown function (DUF6582)